MKAIAVQQLALLTIAIVVVGALGFLFFTSFRRQKIQMTYEFCRSRAISACGTCSDQENCIVYFETSGEAKECAKLLGATHENEEDTYITVNCKTYVG